MKTVTLKLAFMLCFAGQSFSQINGVVVDSLTNERMQYCTVMLIDSVGNTADVTITDREGRFTTKQPESGNYLLKISFVAYHYKTVSIEQADQAIFLDTIYLLPNMNELEEITVKGNLSRYREITDKTVVSLSHKVIKSKPDVFQALRTISGITVDRQTKDISVFGSSNTLLLLNGKISNSTEIGTLRTSDIEKIEIITNPGAEYEAQYSAVINVVSKQYLQKGLKMTVYAELFVPFIYNNATLNFQYGLNKIKIFANYNSWMRRSKAFSTTTYSHENFEIIDTLQDIGNRLQLNQYFRAGFDYFINDKNFLSFFSTYSFYRQSLPQSYTANTLSNELYQKSLYLHKQHKYFNDANTFSLYYKHSFDDKSFFDIYSTYGISRLNNSMVSEGTIENNDFYQRNDFNFNRNSLYLTSNYSTELIKNKFKFGATYYYREIESNTLIRDTSYSSFFTEIRPRGFINISRQLNKFSYSLGFALESHKTTISSTFEPFYVPSATISYRLSSNNNLSLSYSRRLHFPQTNQLSSEYTYTGDSLTFFITNPNLQTVKLDRYQLAFSSQQENVFVRTALFLDLSKNPIQRIFSTDGTHTFIMSDNIGQSLKYGVYIMSNFSLFDGILEFSPTVNAYFQDFTYKDYHANDFAYDINLALDLFLDNGLSFYADFTFESKKPIFMGYSTINPYIDIGASYDFFKAKLNTTLNVSPTDMFFGKKYVMGDLIVTESSVEYFKQISLTINYFFQRGKLLRSDRNNYIEKDF